MAEINLFAWASIDEKGKARGGKAGDQTGREVKVANYYNFGQDRVFRFKKVKYGRKAAKIAKIIASDNSVGYNQDERHTLFNACAKLGWDYDKIEKAIKDKTFPICNCDCSSFVATCINIAYGKQLVSCFSTGTMEDILLKHPNEFTKLSVTKASEEWHKGDMPMRLGHVIINV